MTVHRFSSVSDWLDALGEHVSRTHHELLFDDNVGSARGFHCPGCLESWKISSSSLLYGVLPTNREEIRRRIVVEAYQTHEGRRALLATVNRVRREGPSLRFDRDDVV